MDIGRRMTGTYSCDKAAKYIYEHFEKLNLNPKYHYWKGFGDYYHQGFYKSQNIEATLYGIDDSNDEILMVNAHYDTLRTSPGANDDGSGTVAVLAAAYVLSQFEFNRTIKFVTFSGEEVGLIGSRDYVKKIYTNNENIFLDINADTIGRAVTAEGGRNMGIGGTEDSLWILDLIENISKEYGMNFKLRRYQIDRDADRGWSDYWAFLQYGYESITCWGSSDGDPNYHTENDNYDNINFSYLVNTTRHIVGALAYLADFENPYPQIKIVNPKKGRLYYKDRILLDFLYERTVVLKDVHIIAEVKPGNEKIEKVEFYYDDNLEYTDKDLPYEWCLNKTSLGVHKVKLIAYDQKGKTSTDQVKFFYLYIFNKSKK
jgi:hypothetical protein